MKTNILLALPAFFIALSAPAFAKESVPHDSDFANTVTDSDLEKNRGTFLPFVYNISNMTSNVSGNSCINCTTGNNVIGEGALSNLNGFAAVIMNTGNGVSIQQSTQLNVFFNNAGGSNP